VARIGVCGNASYTSDNVILYRCLNQWKINQCIKVASCLHYGPFIIIKLISIYNRQSALYVSGSLNYTLLKLSWWAALFLPYSSVGTNVLL